MSSWQTLDMIARADHARRTRTGEVAFAAVARAVDRGGSPSAAAIVRVWKRVTATAGAPGISGTGTCCRVCCPGTPSAR